MTNLLVSCMMKQKPLRSGMGSCLRKCETGKNERGVAV